MEKRQNEKLTCESVSLSESISLVNIENIDRRSQGLFFIPSFKLNMQLQWPHLIQFVGKERNLIKRIRESKLNHDLWTFKYYCYF